jgi:cytoskeletal protein RodZ
LLGNNVTGWDLVILVIVLAVYLGLLQVFVYWARRVSGDRAPASAGAGPTGT